MTFLDTGIMVGAVLKSHSEHETCFAALQDSARPFTNAHELAEAFATLTGFYKVPTDVEAELTLRLQGSVSEAGHVQDDDQDTEEAAEDEVGQLMLALG